MSAATSAAPATASIDHQASVAGRLCWHAVEICRALDHGVAELQLAIAEAAEHTNALIELALAMTAGEPASAPSARPAVEGTQP